MIQAHRFHDISCGHRVYGHEGKCQHLHGHNYRVHFWVESEGSTPLDKVGRVLDFSVIKSRLCAWLEMHWDHKFLMWREDPDLHAMLKIDPTVVPMDHNPTAENLAWHLVAVVAPRELEGTGCRVVRCEVEETSKCSAIFSLR
jgi:6-pyruvoyltetrahydropterin/6-carboxytetrahydropterin synthase